MSWRDRIPVHPAADLFPMMSDEELKALAEDIRKHGMRNPIVLLTHGGRTPPSIGGHTALLDKRTVVLDGRNRLDAVERFLKSPVTAKDGMLEWDDKFLKFTGFCEEHERHLDPYAYVISANILRRHLTADQKLDMIGKLIKVDPTKPDLQIAKQTKTSPTTVGKVRRRLEAKGDVSTVETRTDTKGRVQPARKKTSRTGTTSTAVKETGTTVPAGTVSEPVTMPPAGIMLAASTVPEVTLAPDMPAIAPAQVADELDENWPRRSRDYGVGVFQQDGEEDLPNGNDRPMNCWATASK
jgi:hypothetical protein